MLPCCEQTLKLMQDIEGLTNCLEFYLKASPYAVLVPELGSSLINEGVKETVKGQIQDMVIQKAVDKVTKADTLPDVNDAIKAVGEMKLRRLQAYAQIHSLGTGSARHHTGNETRFWNEMMELYNPEKAAGSGGWFGWLW